LAIKLEMIMLTCLTHSSSTPFMVFEDTELPKTMPDTTDNVEDPWTVDEKAPEPTENFARAIVDPYHLLDGSADKYTPHEAPEHARTIYQAIEPPYVARDDGPVEVVTVTHTKTFTVFESSGPATGYGRSRLC
jgi:hypothetical protein